jgi:hypothetical protein
MDNNSDIWLSKLRTDPDFYQKIIDRWGVLRLDVLNVTNIFARIDQVTNYLWEAKDREFKRWPRLGTYVWPNCDGAAGGWDIDYVNPTTYDGIISQFKSWIRGRYLWLDQQFLRAPTLVTNGSMLSMSAPAGTIYYTLNNTDPRASGGGLNASAGAYHGTIPLTNGARIFARAFWTNTWSPPANIFYIAALPTLRISEINYHPAPPPTNSPYQDKDFEFVEIQNTGSSVIIWPARASVAESASRLRRTSTGLPAPPPGTILMTRSMGRASRPRRSANPRARTLPMTDPRGICAVC